MFIRQRQVIIRFFLPVSAAAFWVLTGVILARHDVIARLRP